MDFIISRDLLLWFVINILSVCSFTFVASGNSLSTLKNSTAQVSTWISFPVLLKDSARHRPSAPFASLVRKYKNQLVLFTSAPNLEVLEVRAKFYNGTFAGIPTDAFLNAISSESHNLKFLSIAHVTAIKAVLNVIPCFRKLQNLNLSHIDCDIPRSLLKHCASSMTCLQSLTIALA